MLARRSEIDACLKTLAEDTSATLARSDSPHHLVDRFLAAIGWETQDFSKFITQQNERFRKDIFLSTYGGAQHSIPKISHRIWLTSPIDPSFPPDEYISSLVSAIRSSPKDRSHFFWTNCEAVASQIRVRFEMSKCALLVCRFDIEFCNEDLFATVSKFIEARKFVVAADIAKFMVLNKFGGIYADLGVIYDENILQISDLADCMLLLGDNFFFQTSFLAVPPRCDLSLAVLGLMNHPEAFDRECILYSPQHIMPVDEVTTFAGPGVTVAALLFLARSDRNIFLPPQSKHLQWRSQASWYKGDGKFGNVRVEVSKPTFLKLEKYDEYAQKSRDCLTVHGSIGLLEQKLKVLIRLSDFYDENETFLTCLLHFSGSDKGRGWHNYGYIYNYLFNSMRGREPLVMEIGIGTNNPDVSSSMGLSGIPGASLRGWREYFRSNKIIGADLDKRILFEETGIKTFFVDQTRPETISELFDHFSSEKFDLIIDDGLHTFEANFNVLEQALPNLKEGGLFVIEDVTNEQVKRWEEFFATTDLNAVIVAPPNLNNKGDNRFIIVLKSDS
jgi:SAM-dependent methyltransferase